MQVNERTMSLGGDDVLRQTKDFKATQRLERAKAQKRKYEESKKEEEEAQKNAWARLEEEVGEGQEEDADNDDPSFALRPTRKRKEIKERDRTRIHSTEHPLPPISHQSCDACRHCI